MTPEMIDHIGGWALGISVVWIVGTFVTKVAWKAIND